MVATAALARATVAAALRLRDAADGVAGGTRAATAAARKAA